MKKYLLLCLAIVIHLISTAFYPLKTYKILPVYENTYAIVVGIADYKYETTAPDLTWTINDADKFIGFLTGSTGGSIPASNIYLLKDSKAKKANILYYAKQLFAKAGENDRVIFFFSGHGTEGALVPHDGVYNPATHQTYNLLYYTELQDIMKSAKCKTKIIFADACHSGSIKEKEFNKIENKTKPKEPVKSPQNLEVAIMTASSSKEFSIEMPELKMGLFSYYLINGLQGSADANKDKSITIFELHNYVYKQVHATNPKQSPVTFGKFNKNMVVSTIK
jgi:hypothetical protein